MQSSFHQTPRSPNLEILKIAGTSQYIVRHQSQDSHFISIEDAQRYAKMLSNGVQSPLSIKTVSINTP